MASLFELGRVKITFCFFLFFMSAYSTPSLEVKISLQHTRHLFINCSNEEFLKTQESQSELREIRIGRTDLPHEIYQQKNVDSGSKVPANCNITSLLANLIPGRGPKLSEKLEIGFGKEKIWIDSREGQLFSWISVALFDIEQNFFFCAYGMFRCAVLDFNKPDLPWCSEEITSVPGFERDNDRPGFNIQYGPSLELTCTASLPSDTDSELYTLKIMREDNNQTVALWNFNGSVTECAPKGYCSQLTKIEQFLYGMVGVISDKTEVDYTCCLIGPGCEKCNTTNVHSQFTDSVCKPSVEDATPACHWFQCYIISGCFMALGLVIGGILQEGFKCDLGKKFMRWCNKNK